jgi:CDGSH-type Zn-finger protein/uncharacterized Fe-S cluster protein YjdI
MSDMSKVRGYDGDEIRVTFEASRCIHAAQCVSRLPTVFDTSRRPWIDPNGAPADDIEAVVRLCPTGALKYERTDGGTEEKAGPVNKLTIAANGPLFARGEIEVVDGERRLVARDTRAAFCRCGASANKPWCDGSHANAGFNAPADLGEGRLKPAPDDPTGALVIRLRPNGPLVLDGPFRLGAKGSDDAVEAGGCALCRCGASANKPFCDGAHNSIGFKAVDPVGS